jgi:hypothetical protein
VKEERRKKKEERRKKKRAKTRKGDIPAPIWTHNERKKKERQKVNQRKEHMRIDDPFCSHPV